jgi:3-phosphoshikimate 1-carboxyvinyltransferase
MKLKRASAVVGTPELPGDKSISHRAALIAAIADGETRIKNFSASADCVSTLNCLRELGVQIKVDGSEVAVMGVGKTGLRLSNATLDCGNSGTTIRLLAGILAGQDFESTLTGDDSLKSRPMERISMPLTQMGASVISTDGHAPLKIQGRNPLKPVEFRLPVASAQIKSAILLAGLNANGETTVIESAPTRDHTERMLELFGIEVRSEDRDGKRISVSGGQPVSPGDTKIPADISAGSFFMVAAASLPGSDITLRNLGINPTRSAIIDVLKSLGVGIDILNVANQCNEPTATVKIRGGLEAMQDKVPARINGALIPNLIDEIPILAVLGTQLANGLEVRDATELRHKESDRISSIVKNLELMGAEVTEFSDGFCVKPSRLTGARLDAYGDHRIAMAFAVAGLLADGETEIEGADCAAVSFPGFFEILHGVVR